MKLTLTVFFLSVAAVAQVKTHRDLKPLPSLSETIEWLTGASQEEAGWGGGYFHFTSDGKCNAEISTYEFLEHTDSDKKIRTDKYSFRLAEIDPTDIRFQPASDYYVVSFHTRNYKESISFTLYKDAIPNRSDKEVEYTKMVRSTLTSDLRTNDWFAPRFVKAFRRAVELCGGKESSY